MEENKSPPVDAVMSLSLFSLFISIFPYLPLSTGGGGGRPNSSRDEGGGAVVAAASPHTSHLLYPGRRGGVRVGGRWVEKCLDKSLRGVTRLPCSPCVMETEGRGETRREKNMTNERESKNNPSEASVPSVMPVPSDGLHQTEVNRNKWLELLLSEGALGFSCLRRGFLHITSEHRLARNHQPGLIFILN